MPSHPDLIEGIREKHSLIKKGMDGMTSEAFGYHAKKERWPKQEIPRLIELADAFKKVEAAGLPKAIADHLRHPDVERILRDSLERDKMETRMAELLASGEVEKLLREFKKAEENVHSGHEAKIYQAGFDRAAEAMEALTILRVDKNVLPPSRALDEAWEALFNIREYCRSAANRHAIWLINRGELKDMLMDLARHPSVGAEGSITPELRATPQVQEIVEHAITADTGKIRRAAEELVRQALQK